MHPTIDLDFIEIPVYTALVALGMGAGLVAACFFLRPYSRRVYAVSFFLDGSIVTFVAGWIGARAYHVATHWDYYSARPDEIAQFGAGGLAIRGAILTGMLALALYAGVRHVSFGRLADASALGLALGQAIGWIGALIWGANYGAVSDSAIAMDLPNIYGLVEPRYPLQYAEIALFAILFVVLLVLSFQCPKKGEVFLVYLFTSSLVNFALGFLRGDESMFIGTFRVDQIFDAAFALIALAGIAFRTARATARAGTVNAK